MYYCLYYRFRKKEIGDMILNTQAIGPSLVRDRTHAVECLLLSVQFDGSGDHTRNGINAEILPVPVPRSSLQETVPHLSIHTFVLIRRKHLIHHQAGRLLLKTKNREKKGLFVLEYIRIPH